MSRTLGAWLGLGVWAFVLGCGGSTRSATANEVDVPPFEELKGIVLGLQEGSDRVTQPVAAADRVITELRQLPAQHGMSLEDFVALLRAVYKGEPLQRADGTALDAEFELVVRDFAGRLADVVNGLTALPENCAQLSVEVLAALPKVTLLAPQATASATARTANVFGPAADRQAAQAELQEIQTLVNDAMQRGQQLQQVLTALPGKAAGALSQLALSLAVSGDDVLALIRTRAPSPAASGPAEAAAPEPVDGIRPFDAFAVAEQRVQAAITVLRGRLSSADASVAELEGKPEALAVSRDWLRLAMLDVSEGRSISALDGAPASPELAAEVESLAHGALRTLAELEANARDAELVRGAIAEARQALPQWARLAGDEARAVSAAAGVPAADRQAAEAELAGLPELERASDAALLALSDTVDAIEAESRTQFERLAALFAEHAALLVARAQSSVSVEPGLEPMPQVRARAPLEPPAPALAEAPAPPEVPSEPTSRAAGHARASNLGWWLASGTMAAASLAMMGYTIQRAGALDECESQPPGFGCSNTSTLETQRTVGLAVALSMAGGTAITAVIALVRGGARSESRAAHAMGCTASPLGALCAARF